LYSQSIIDDFSYDGAEDIEDGFCSKIAMVKRYRDETAVMGVAFHQLYCALARLADHHFECFNKTAK
jgi:hypothetical protein